MTPRIMVLGAGVFLSRSIRRIRQGGFRVIAVDRNPNAPGFAEADKSIVADISTPDAIMTAAVENGVDGILSLNDFGALAAAKTAEALQLPGNGVEPAVRSIDKRKMRDAWSKAGLEQPAYRIVQQVEDAKEAVASIGFPCLIKPAVSGGGGRGVLIVKDESQLASSFEDARAFALSGELLIEEYVDGVEMTVETLVEGGVVYVLSMSEKRKPDIRYRVAVDLFFPPAMSNEILTTVSHVAQRAVSALGIRYGAAHTEVILTPCGRVVLIECAARGGGGHLTSDIVEWTKGVAYPVEWAKICCGVAVDIRSIHDRAAIYHFFCPPAGRLIRVEGMEKARKLPGVLDIGSLRAPGEKIPNLTSSLQRSGYAVLCGNTRREVEEVFNQVVSVVRYVVDQEKFVS